MKENQMGDDSMLPGKGGVGSNRGPTRLHEAVVPPAQPRTIVDMFSKTEDPEILGARRREAKARAQQREWTAIGVIAFVVWLVLIMFAVLPPLVLHLWKTF